MSAFSAVSVIVLSTAFEDLLVRRYGVRQEAVRVVRPGVDLVRFHLVDGLGGRELLTRVAPGQQRLARQPDQQDDDDEREERAAEEAIHEDSRLRLAEGMF